jgi:hypothetical protein
VELFFLLWRNGGAGQYKQARFIIFVNLRPNSVPNTWNNLPFINEAGFFAFE